MDTVQLQNVYITAEGALQYTGVHSATSPVGSQGTLQISSLFLPPTFYLEIELLPS